MKVSLTEVKNALNDGRFRDILPLEVRDDVVKYLQNPGCACNIPIYRKILKLCKKQLKEYYPNAEEVVDEAEEMQKLAQNHWKVINCTIDELENKLKSLGPGRKQIALCRDNNKNITVVVNELDFF